MPSSSLQRAPRLAALSLLAFALTGCQVISGSPQYARVRFLDASPDAPDLDLYQNATATLYDIGFGTASSYIAVAPGPYTGSVDVTGTRQQLANVAGTLALGAQYTVLVGNTSASLQMSLLKDQSTPAPAGQTALRFLNQSTRSGPVDIYLVAAYGTLAGTAPLLTNLSFNNTPRYINVPSGTYSIAVLPAAASPGSAPNPAPTLSNTLPLLYSGNQVLYPAASARTILLVDQTPTDKPGVLVIAADDYDAPTTT